MSCYPNSTSYNYHPLQGKKEKKISPFSLQSVTYRNGDNELCKNLGGVLDSRMYRSSPKLLSVCFSR